MDKIIFTGNVGKDTVVETKNGSTYAKFTVAVTHFSKGEKTTEWRNVVAFGKAAEYCQKYVTKGKTVLIDGRPTIRAYKNKLDEYVATMDVAVNTIECVGNKHDGDQETTNQAAQSTPAGFVPVEADGDLPF